MVSGNDSMTGSTEEVQGSPRTLHDLIPLVAGSTASPHTQRAYRAQLENFLDWHKRTAPRSLSPAVVRQYLRALQRSGKSVPTVNQALTALRKLADEAAGRGLLNPKDAAAISRIRAVRREKQPENGLNPDQARALMRAPDPTTLKGKRDRVLIALLAECGLTREEAAGITVEQIQYDGGRTVIVDVVGKAGRTRTVLVPWRTADKIGDWILAARIQSGPLLRAVNKADRLEEDGIGSAAIYKQVRKYGAQVGVDIPPQDLRRAFAQAQQRRGAEIGRIQEALGHRSRSTTRRYLGLSAKPEGE